MSKRTVFEANSRAAHTDRQPKRLKFDDAAPSRASPQASAEEVTSARQLQNALIFDQGYASGLRTGLNLLKRFLDSILYSADGDDLPRKRAILCEFLETQKDKKGDKDGFLQNLFQAWDYAAESNFEPLLAQLTAMLALLFKVFASHADFLEYGSLLARTILKPSVARRLVRSLSAATNKENVIAPALRLLIELTKFNEGAHAKAVYARKDFTFEPKILARNIGMWKESKGETSVELHRKPSVRTTAVRYLLTHLKYQDEHIKAEILSNTQITRSLLDNLHTDPPFLIFEIFEVLKNHVFQDKAIPRNVKSRMLNGRALSHIASLYRYELTEGLLGEGEKAPDELAHEFLCLICTSPAYGVMLPSSGLYPPRDEDGEGDAPMEDAADYDAEFGLDLIEEKTHRIRNVILADFIQTLRPYSNRLQQDLVTTIFKACPELVADYYTKKVDFNYDPKLTATWIGFSALIYQTIELPVPEFLGGRKGYRDYPPPISTMMPSILPQPLTQAVLTRCLNHSADLIQFFAVRVLIVAFNKLRSVLQELSYANTRKPSNAWQIASNRLVAEFCKRCPLIKTVILAWKTPAFQQKVMKREAITRLLSLYYEVTPQVALRERFDVSLPLCNALKVVEKHTEASEDSALHVIELEHWMKIARLSPSMRWWQKNKTLQHSPFMTLILLVVSSAENELYAGVKELLVAILRDQEMLQMDTRPDALDALIASLSAFQGSSSPPKEVFEFLDDCCARFTKAPIKYSDDLDAARARCSQTAAQSGPFSPLLMTLAEQWPYKGGKPDKSKPAQPLAQWLSNLLYLLKLIGEDESLLQQVRDKLVETADVAYKEVLKDAFLWKMGKEKTKQALKLATGVDFSGSERSSASPTPPEQSQAIETPTVTADLELPPKEDEKHSGLTRWKKKDMEESVDDGDVGELVLCLCSQHTEIRLQAMSNIRQLMAMIDTDSDFFQHKVLLGEVAETAETRIAAEPLPYVAGVLAARCVSVLADPTHFMFAKINKFLTERPEWQVERLPRRFIKTLLHDEPDEAGSYHKEVDWLLDYFIDCLRTPEDLEIFRKNNVVERLLSFYLSKSSSIAAKEKIVRLLFRAAAVGGSTMLITRCGFVNWITMMDDLNDHRRRTLKQLATRVYETCDQEKLKEWSNGTMGLSMEDMVA
ncbi:hypothetical protein BS50DRAFT_560853 [Corynespora cassiicola Philippines]|uniref:Ribosome biogenesis protein Urb1 n=1 Tax=Corynespora cassiicola Philippines TaxID=1448308 RepID=A0A2T2N942_CORCC|nr:hypothetical protein BS50DRAFT_560853 [Corynespora cassiicola Philippines]